MISDRAYSLSIRQLPEEIRPRERLQQRGAGALNDVELVSLLIGQGRKGANALDVARELLAVCGGLESLASLGESDLVGLSGLGPAKAARLAAAVELGKRVASGLPPKRLEASGPEAVAGFLTPRMRYLDREHFCAVLVNTKNKVLKIIDVAVGSLNEAIVHPRELFKAALRENAAGMILAHNHPSGDPMPSRGDIALTQRLRKAGELLGIEVMDHLVIGDGSYISFKRQGWFGMNER